MRSCVLHLLALGLLIGAQGAQDASAADESKHKLRLGFTVASSTGGYEESRSFESFFSTTTATTVAEGGTAVGFRLGYEFRPTPRLGIALDVESVSLDIGFTDTQKTESTDPFSLQVSRETTTGVAGGALRMTPLTLGLNVYVSMGDAHDFYVGPVLGYMFYDKLRQDGFAFVRASDGATVTGRSPAAIELEDDTALGIMVGLDLKLGGGNGSFHIAAGYLDGSVDAKDPDIELDMDVDPILARIGVVFRF